MSTATASPRRSTAHLKEVPPTLALRESLRDRCAEVATRLERDVPLTKDEMESVARGLLDEADLPESYLGWAMVMLSSEYWRDSLAAVPPERRLFLLPHCLKHAAGCPAEYDQFGLNCKECGACSIADYRGLAESLGYRVLVAEGSPVVMKIIVGGYVDAVVGVACLNVLEKAIDKVLLAGIPCMAVPLLSDDCRDTTVDAEWVNDMIRVPHRPSEADRPRTYVHLMRAASELFGPDQLTTVVPPVRGAGHAAKVLDAKDLASVDPVAATERMAYDFLSRGGKHSRPMITLAAYDAVTGGAATGPDGEAAVGRIPLAVRRSAAAIEVFHKASLVHDDIEDDDAVRYGVASVHRRFGTADAINVGDYLIGLGYRLLSMPGADDDGDAADDPAVRADVVAAMSRAHLRLSEGQGAEMLWRSADRMATMTPLDAMKVYALKTAPAFEAALSAGVRHGVDAATFQFLRKPLADFARNLGVGFQVLNDIADHYGDEDNKGAAAGDLAAARPTLLWALALQMVAPEDRERLIDSIGDGVAADERIELGRRLYESADVIPTALRLVDKHRTRAAAAAGTVAEDGGRPELARLMAFLIDSVLEPPKLPGPAVYAIG